MVVDSINDGILRYMLLLLLLFIIIIIYVEAQFVFQDISHAL